MRPVARRVAGRVEAGRVDDPKSAGCHDFGSPIERRVVVVVVAAHGAGEVADLAGKRLRAG